MKKPEEYEGVQVWTPIGDMTETYDERVQEDGSYCIPVETNGPWREPQEYDPPLRCDLDDYFVTVTDYRKAKAALAEAVELLERFSKASVPQAYYGQYSIRLATKAFLDKHGGEDQ